MKKYLCLLLLGVIAELKAQEPLKDAQDLTGEAAKLKESTDSSKSHWKKGATINITGQQVSLTNWAGGGQSAVSGSGLTSLFLGYKNGKITWNNNLDLAYGFIKQATNRKWWKNDDRIQFTSRFGREAFKNAYYSALLDFKTQFAPGYNYPNDSVMISGPFAPAYIVLALGMEFKPVKDLSFFIAPVSTRITIVANDTLAKYGAFGVQKQTTDPITHQVVTPYQKVREQYGAYFRMMYRKTIMENITFATMLELFSDYVHDPQDLYVNWTTLTTFKVNKYIGATVSTQLIYDKSVMIKSGDGKTGPRVQFKEVLGLGFSHKF